jgi:3-deoxy-D-manno-octulosonic-acid transferase
MAETLIAAGGGRRVHSADELYSAVQQLLAAPDQLAAMGRKAQNFVKENSGALARSIAYVSRLLGDKQK